MWLCLPVVCLLSAVQGVPLALHAKTRLTPAEKDAKECKAEQDAQMNYVAQIIRDIQQGDPSIADHLKVESGTAGAEIVAGVLGGATSHPAFGLSGIALKLASMLGHNPMDQQYMRLCPTTVLCSGLTAADNPPKGVVTSKGQRMVPYADFGAAYEPDPKQRSTHEAYAYCDCNSLYSDLAYDQEVVRKCKANEQRGISTEMKRALADNS
jgi:hypothetical protein